LVEAIQRRRSPVRTSSIPEDKNRSEDPCRIPPSKQLSPTAHCQTPLAQNIEAIVTLQTNSQRDLPRHQRVVEAVTAFFFVRRSTGSCSRLLWIPQHLTLAAFDSSTRRRLHWLGGRFQCAADDNRSLNQANPARKLAEQRA